MAETSTRVFRLTAEGLERLGQDWRRKLRRRAPLFPAGMLAVIYFSSPESPTPFLLAAAVGAVFLGFMMPRLTLTHLKKKLATFELHVGANSLLRKQDGFRDLLIYRRDVRGFAEIEQGILVRTGDFHVTLFIPKQIEGIEEVRTTLSEWTGPVSAMSQRLFTLGMIAAGLLTGLAHQLPRWVEDPSLIALAHVVAAAAAYWFFLELRRNPQVDEDTRKYAWGALLWIAIELGSAWRAFQTQWPGA
jgi:hypothetical protein